MSTLPPSGGHNQFPGLEELESIRSSTVGMSQARPVRDARVAHGTSQRQNNNAPKRKRAPIPAEWERIRPLVEQYLIEEEKPLERVREILSKHHNFEAELVGR